MLVTHFGALFDAPQSIIDLSFSLNFTSRTLVASAMDGDTAQVNKRRRTSTTAIRKLWEFFLHLADVDTRCHKQVCDVQVVDGKQQIRYSVLCPFCIIQGDSAVHTIDNLLLEVCPGDSRRKVVRHVRKSHPWFAQAFEVDTLTHECDYLHVCPGSASEDECYDADDGFELHGDDTAPAAYYVSDTDPSGCDDADDISIEQIADMQYIQVSKVPVADAFTP